MRPLIPTNLTIQYGVNVAGWVRGGRDIWNEGLRQGIRAMLQRWYRDYMPRHFKQEAYTRYGYKGRGARYVRYKIKAFGHNDPLVFGQTMDGKKIRKAPMATLRGMVTGKEPQIVAKTTFGTLRMEVPAYITNHPHIGDRGAKELTTVTEEEMTRLGQHFTVILADFINQHKTGKEKTAQAA